MLVSARPCAVGFEQARVTIQILNLKYLYFINNIVLSTQSFFCYRKDPNWHSGSWIRIRLCSQCSNVPERTSMITVKHA